MAIFWSKWRDAARQCTLWIRYDTKCRSRACYSWQLAGRKRNRDRAKHNSLPLHANGPSYLSGFKQSFGRANCAARAVKVVLVHCSTRRARFMFTRPAGVHSNRRCAVCTLLGSPSCPSVSWRSVICNINCLRSGGWEVLDNEKKKKNMKCFWKLLPTSSSLPWHSILEISLRHSGTPFPSDERAARYGVQP